MIDLAAQRSPIHQGSVADDPRRDAHRPTPDPATGALAIDPEIELKARRFNLAISFHYDTNGNADEEYGRRRSASVKGYVLSATNGQVVTVVRGDGSEAWYQRMGSSGGVTTFASATNQPVASSLTYDGSRFSEHFPDGMKLLYQSQVGGTPVKHELVGVADACGSVHSYAYGSGGEAGLLKSIEVPGGAKVTLHYAAGSPTSLLDHMEDWAGRCWTFQYDANRELTTFTAPTGCTTRYTYSLTPGSVTMVHTIEDARGYRTTYSYDSSNRVVSMAAGAAVWNWGYDTVNRVTTMTSPSGGVTTYQYDTGGNLSALAKPEGYTVTYQYDAKRFLIKEQLPAGYVYSLAYTMTADGLWRMSAADDGLGNRTTYQYDSHGNLTTLTDAEAKTTTFGYAGDGSTHLRVRQTDPLGRVTVWAHDGYGQVCSITDARGLVTTNTWDSYGNLQTVTAPDGTVTTHAYDALNRLTTVTAPLGLVTVYGYDDADNRTSVTNPAGETTQYVYEQCLLTGIEDPLGNETTYSYGRFGNKLTETDPLGAVTSWSYDSMGFLETVTDPLGNVSTIVYNAARQKTADVDPLGKRTSYTYDSSGRPETVEDARNNVTTTVYDAKGQVTAILDALSRRTSFSYDKVGRRKTVEDPLNHVTTTSYDDAGQVSAVVDAANVALTFSYDNNGNRTEVRDALNHRTTYAYESNSNRLQAVVNALGHTVTHYYDLAGRQTAVQDARGNRTSFTYDDAGRLETQTDPLNYVTTYLYDAAGRNTTLVDATGAVKTTTFDAAGRVVSLLYADGKRVTFQYDAGGRRTTMVDWDGTTTYAYSARGELTGKTEPTGLRMTMLYDSVGNRTTLTEPDGYHYTFGYDALNRPIRLRDPNAYVLTFQYDAAGRRTTLLDSTGITRVYQYDSVGRLTTQVDSNSGGTGLVTFVDGYDEVGNRISGVKDGVATTWVYDAVYRLTNQQKSGQAATFVYDNAGNITVKHHEGSNPLTMSYDAGNRITTSVLGSSQFTTFTHDANGNMTGERCDYLSVLSTFVYDSENRCLNELRSSGAHHTYTYAPDGLRRSAHHGGAANPVSFVWDGDDLLNEYRLGGVSCRYDVLDGEVLGERRDGSRYLYVPDPLGSVNHLLDTGQTIAGTYVYWPYGEVQSHTGPDTPMQFVGGLGYYTGVVNRAYVRARWLRPDLGRWQTADPIGFAGGDWNLFVYAACSPTISADATGKFQMPGYGNYCGPDRPPPGTRRLPDPVDALDICCKGHDRCYLRARISPDVWRKCLPYRRCPCKAPPDLKSKCDAIIACDLELCACALIARCPRGLPGLTCRLAQTAIVAWMCNAGGECRR